MLLVILLMLFTVSGSFVVWQRSFAGHASGDFCRAEFARDFISFQQRARGNEYQNIELYTTVNLYDHGHNVVANAYIVYRDGEFDYVVINHITDQIDEWGIDEREITEHFKSGERIYFGGALTYSVRDGYEYVDFNGTRLDRTEFVRRSSEFRTASTSRRDESRRRRRTITSGYDFNDGLLSWIQVIQRHHEDIFINAGYLQGIYRNGISGAGLSFANQSELSNTHLVRHGRRVTGVCGPTMQVNLLIYLHWRGFGTLINGNRNDTFDRSLALTGWPGSTITRCRNSVRQILREQGHTYIMHNLGSSFAGFRDSIERGHPAMMGIHRGNVGHGVVVVGFEHFRLPTPNAHVQFHYLRIIDGWGTSNASRFVCFNGFFQHISGASFWIA